MPIGRRLEDTVARLAADLRPVRCLPPPSTRAAGWIGLVLAMAAALASFCDLPALGHRLSVAPDMWVSVLGSSTTAVLAALAAFELCIPGRSVRWALLPVPSLLLWVSASGLGCLRGWASPVGAAGEAGRCFTHILAMSIPLMAVMAAMVRRACPLRPNLTALVSGLAVAAASATLLNFDHPFDASALDLVAHLAAILSVIAVNQVVARRTA